MIACGFRECWCCCDLGGDGEEEDDVAVGETMLILGWFPGNETEIGCVRRPPSEGGYEVEDEVKGSPGI